MSNKRQRRIRDFSDALEQLNEASRVTPVGLQKGAFFMQGKYKEFAQDVQEQVVQSVNQARDKVVDATQDAARRVDSEVHRNPWPYIGIAALVSAMLAFFLGRSSRR